MVSFRGKKKLGPRPDRSLLGVQFKNSDKHPCHVHIWSPPPPGPTYLPMLTILSYTVYLALKPGDYANETAAVSFIQSCIREILILGKRQQLEKVITSNLVVGESRISPSTKVKNLGSCFESNLDMLSHVNNICSSSFYYVYNICRIRKYLSHQTVISLIHAFITSKLDYCNSLLYGLPTTHINKLQRVQNAAARLVTNTPRICHITPILKDLHWLPIKYRIEFKIVLLTFKCLYGLAPQYLVDLIAVAAQTRYNLMSRNATHGVYLDLVTEPFSRLLPNCGTVFRRRSETFRASHLLKRALKTYFFKIAFYYINTNEIPGEISRENMISSHLKISPLPWLHNKSRLSQEKLFH